MKSYCSKIEDLTVQKVMQANLITITLDANIYEASLSMTKNQISLLPVLTNDGCFVGVITSRDVIERCIAKHLDPFETKISQCTSKFLYKISPEMSCSNAIFLMSKYGVKKLLVVKHEKLIGIISASDIAKVYNFCPNKECPKHDCILIDIANEQGTTSHLEPGIEINILKNYEAVT